MKKNNLKYIITFIGAVLVLTAVIAISRSLVSPHSLNAQGLPNGKLPQTSTISLSEPKTLSLPETQKPSFPSASLSDSSDEKKETSSQKKGSSALAIQPASNSSSTLTDVPFPSLGSNPSSLGSSNSPSLGSNPSSLGSNPLPAPKESTSVSTGETKAPTPSFSQIPSLPMSENIQKSDRSSSPISAPAPLAGSPAASTSSSQPLPPPAVSDVPFPTLPPLPASETNNVAAGTPKPSLPENAAKNNISLPPPAPLPNSDLNSTAVSQDEKKPLAAMTDTTKESLSLLSQNGTPVSSADQAKSNGLHANRSDRNPSKSETTNNSMNSSVNSDPLASFPSETANAPIPPMPNIPVHQDKNTPAMNTQTMNAPSTLQKTGQENPATAFAPMASPVPNLNSATLPGPPADSVANFATTRASDTSNVRKPSSDFIDPSQTVSKPAVTSNLPVSNLPVSNSPVNGTSVRNAQNSDLNGISPISNQAPALIGSGMPGETSLEGEQHAQIVIFKDMPNEVQVGREETFTIRVKNIGNREAKEVVLQEQLPAKTRLVKMDPQGTTDTKGYLIWNNFDLAPSQEKTFTYKAIPLEQGEIGSIASISFRSEASGRTKCTKPELKVEVNAPKEVEIGDDVPLEILISNTGTGTATGVTIVENVPKGLTHPGGSVLDNQIDKIAAGEAKKLSLTLKGANPGKTINILKLTADNGTQKEIQTEIQVNAPELKLEITGAAQRFLERESTYVLKVSNPGTATAKNIGIEVKLPENVTFVKTNNYGLYKKESHSVRWELVELPQNIEPGEIELVVMPSKLGKGKFIVNAKGDKGLSTESSKEVLIDGLAALSYTIKPVTDVVEVGQNAVYEIKIANHGTKSSSNVNLQVLIPDEMKMVESDGPTKYRIQNGAIVFDNLQTIGAKQEVVYKIKTICSAPGDHRIKVQVSSDDFERLVKEESIRAYH